MNEQLAFEDALSAATRRTILVVDDEASIRRTLESILRDEGYNVLLAADGESAIQLVKERSPDLVLLDIWMPGKDGLETLKEIKRSVPDTGVIMISGHATIATAVMATRFGAADFIEKPLDLHAMIHAVRRVLEKAGDDSRAIQVELNPARLDEHKEREGGGLSIGKTAAAPLLNPIVFNDQLLRGENIGQKTLAHSALLYGQGLHSGKKSGLILEPLPAHSGIHFVGVSETTIVPAHIDFVESTGFATTLRLGGTHVGTIEHIMSALHAYGISNLLIKCNGEVPVMDGSAKEFCSLIEQIGVEEQEGNWYEIEVREPIMVGDEREYIRLEPADTFTIDYTLQYPTPVGKQHMEFTLDSVERYKSEIAPARTFGFVKDIGALQRQGLALGGRFDNFVLFGEEGPINDELRFPNEPVRHKILDAIGDLYLLGRRIRGRVVACMTGHSDNVDLLKALKTRMQAQP